MSNIDVLCEEGGGSIRNDFRIVRDEPPHFDVGNRQETPLQGGNER